MELGMQVSADFMVAVFLQAEIGSPRFAETVLHLLGREGCNRRIVDQPDLNDPAENARRANLLREWRGYERNEDVFTDLPDDTVWYQATLDPSDLDRLNKELAQYAGVPTVPLFTDADDEVPELKPG